MYRIVDAALVRAGALPSSLDIPPWPDLTGKTDEHVEQWRAWLRQVWDIRAIADAVEVASPVLARRIRRACGGDLLPPRQVRRAALSLARYVLRATSRPTPFGLFAGIAPARFGRALHIRFGEQHQATARVDSEWLAAVITRLETCSELRRRLPVVLNNLAFVRDGRVVVGCQQQAGASSSTAPAEVSIRHTKAVETVMQAARSPILMADLVDKLRADFPTTSAPVIERMLAELVAQRLLITSLRAPMTTSDPLAHVVDELAAVGALDVPEVAKLVAQLRDTHLDLSRHARARMPTIERDLRTAVTTRMDDISATERPLGVDLRVDCELVLPHVVAQEAEAAAEVLTRLAPYPSGTPSWRDFHSRFLERYGMAALVPVREVLNSDTGLGFPSGYRDTRLKLPSGAGLSERDETLLALAQKAGIENRIEVVLDDKMIAQLAVDDVNAVQPHTELRFRLHAPEPGALDRGEFDLAVVGVSRAAGSTTGRFLDILDPVDRGRMVGAYAGLPTVNEDAIPVQVSCPVLYLRAENVARSPVVLPQLVSTAEHRTPGGGLIHLDDLAVTGDAECLYLMSISQHRPVEPMVFSAVEFTNASHPLLRFLCEISTARAAACAPFSWGAASRLPFLPRIRYRRTILSPARWTLAASELPGPAAAWPDWVEDLTAWRRRYSVPASVYLSDDDRRLRLALDERAHQHLLRADLDRTGRATLREAPDGNALGWCNGRAHEIVVPLLATQPSRPASRKRNWPGRVIGTEHGHLPGASDWLYLKLYGHPDRQTTILITHLPDLLATWDSPPEWWFLRYEDPEPHLRLRIRLPGPDHFGETARRVGMWTVGLRRLGLVGQAQLDTYYPETGRFGDGLAMAAAESLFAADSTAAVAQLTATGHRGASHQHAVIAASVVDLVISFTGELDRGMRWLIEHARTTSPKAPAREVLNQAVRLADPREGWAALRATPGGVETTTAWNRRRTALTTYRDALVRVGETTPEMLLPDLVHLHVVRMLGLSPDAERACARLARAAALSWMSRAQGAP